MESINLNVIKRKYMIFATTHKIKNFPKIDVEINDLSISLCNRKNYLSLILD